MGFRFYLCGGAPAPAERPRGAFPCRKSGICGGILPIIWWSFHFLAKFVGSPEISAFYPTRRAPFPAERPRGPFGPSRTPAGRPFLGGICSEPRGNLRSPHGESLCFLEFRPFTPAGGPLPNERRRNPCGEPFFGGNCPEFR